MAAQLLIVQNELKDGRGHYLETAVSVAEAAAELGLRPTILGHVTCPPELIPAPFAFLPICRLDHHCHFPPAERGYGLNPKPLPVESKFRRRLRKLVPPFLLARSLSEGSIDLDPSLTRRANEKGFGHEIDRIADWVEEFELFEKLFGWNTGDHVLFLTAHARELHAVRRYIELHPQKCPTFHLEFRHALDFDAEGKPQNSFTAVHDLLFRDYRRFGASAKVQLYTDTEEMSAQYAGLTQLPHFTLPIPFRNGKLPKRFRSINKPVRIAFVGDPRDEKGFHHLPAIIAGLAGEPVRFAIQASFVDPGNNPQSAKAVEWLRENRSDRVELFGESGPLIADEYFARIAGADLILFPFDARSYARRSSGTLTEAIAAGVPTVVTAGTWLAKQQPSGTGEVGSEIESWLGAIRKIVRDYSNYAGAAEAARESWLKVHTPENFVRALLADRVTGAEAPQEMA